MKILVTHKSCDPDGITGTWLLKRFLPGWQDAKLAFVPAGNKLEGKYEKTGEAIEQLSGNEVIHVDTGLGKLDHHQTSDQNVCGASLAFDYVCEHGNLSANEVRREAARRIVDLVIDNDHFQDVYRKEPTSYFDDISFFAIIDGVKLEHPGEDEFFANFGYQCLDALLRTFENRIWAEKEIKEKGTEFSTKWGRALGVETQNDYVLEIGQKNGFVIVVRKDPKFGFVRIKARPNRRVKRGEPGHDLGIDLTPVHEELKKRDPYATWFLHISKRMLLNGSAKNPTSISTKLPLAEIIEVIESIH